MSLNKKKKKKKARVASKLQEILALKPPLIQGFIAREQGPNGILFYLGKNTARMMKISSPHHNWCHSNLRRHHQLSDSFSFDLQQSSSPAEHDDHPQGHWHHVQGQYQSGW